MNLEKRKIDFIQEVLSLQSVELFDKLENLLKKEKTNDFPDSMSVEELNARLAKSEKDFEEGKFQTQEELSSRYK